MLSRALTRSLRTPGLLRPPATLRIVSSTVWTRSLARHNKPSHDQNRPIGQNKSIGQSKQPGNSQSPPPGGHFAAFNPPQQAPQGSKKPSQLDFSKKQVEVNNEASSQRNTIPQSTGSGAGNVNATSRRGQDPAFSGKQDDFDTWASASQNTASRSTSPFAIDPAEAQTQNQPLPDLTQGIPSTLEFEARARSAASGLNLTEAGEPGEGPGGRGRGELPASAYISSSEKKRLRVANYLYAASLGVVVAGAIYLGRNWESEEEETQHPNAPSGWAFGLMWKRAKARFGDQYNYYSEPAFRKLLPDVDPIFERPYTLVMSLEDLLIHSEWSREHGWRMAKRPGVDYFLRYLSQYYEIVVFTSQPWAVAEPVLKKLDPYHIITWPLFREATLYDNGEYIKDLSYLNRDLAKVVIIDTKAIHTSKQPENAIILKPWEGQKGDKELVSLIPFLEYIHTMASPDTRKVLKSFEGTHIPTEFAKREAVMRKKHLEQLEDQRKKHPHRSGANFLTNALGLKPQGMMMTDPNEQSTSEALAEGKTLLDIARERGQRTYEMLEKEIRENGEKWLKEEALQEEKAKEEGMKAMKSGFTGWFGGSGNQK